MSLLSLSLTTEVDRAANSSHHLNAPPVHPNINEACREIWQMVILDL